MFNFRQLTSKIEVAKMAFTATRGEVAKKQRHVEILEISVKIYVYFC
jgi:hypothetical protein